jgi:hypothetical protein
MIKLENWMVEQVMKDLKSPLYQRSSGAFYDRKWSDELDDSVVGVTVNHLHDVDVVKVIEYQFGLPMKTESHISLSNFTKAYQ